MDASLTRGDKLKFVGHSTIRSIIRGGLGVTKFEDADRGNSRTVCPHQLYNGHGLRRLG